MTVHIKRGPRASCFQYAMRWITMDDRTLFPVACPSRDSVTDSGPPISGVAAVSSARFNVNDIAPSGPARIEVSSIWVSLRNRFSSVVSYSLPARENVLDARPRSTNATELLPSSNWALAALSLVMVKVSMSFNGTAPLKADTSTLEKAFVSSTT